MKLLQGNNIELLKQLPDNSVDAVVTDPPYGLGKEPDALAMLRDWLETGHHDVKGRGFMGKEWDAFVPQPQQWREIYRVLKPGGHILAFAGTRTQDLMALGLRLAGFEIRDLVAWVYGSGFPKSHNLKDDWQGWGTALKPALEPITLARKPLEGTVAENVLKWHTGAVNVNGCRVGTSENLNGGRYSDNKRGDAGNCYGSGINARSAADYSQPAGRWPANLIHDGSEEVTGLFPVTTSGDTGSASRFFYCAKASKKDRDEGLELCVIANRQGNQPGSPDETGKFPDHDHRERTGNFHPTIKPTDLMRYLCRLITPPGGVVLDPWMGSGSTGKAAKLEGFDFIGMEMDKGYFDIACARTGYKETVVDWI